MERNETVAAKVPSRWFPILRASPQQVQRQPLRLCLIDCLVGLFVGWPAAKHNTLVRWIRPGGAAVDGGRLICSATVR